MKKLIYFLICALIMHNANAKLINRQTFDPKAHGYTVDDTILWHNYGLMWGG